MIPEIGQLSLAIALAIALVQGIIPLVGALRQDASWMALARPAAQAQLLFVLSAFGCLAWSFVQHDFTVLYVVSNSNSSLPLSYCIAAVWGGHEGSVLLWAVMLGFWMLAVAQFSRHLPLPMVANILSVMSLISCGFLMFILFTSNPFDRLFPAAADGHDLNPMLQDPGMIFHPPLLYMGYVGFSVPFAFAIAALLSNNLDSAWARWARPWTTAAWAFLTVGICLGSAWAYYVLGWGGWWFWDPVENASFMPWLVGTALIHSLAVTEKRGSFKAWTALLAIVAFSLSLLGTFLVRSGVLSSVHAFATDPRRGIFILAFLAAVVGGSLLLFAWRAVAFDRGGRIGFVSRESMLLANNVMFAAIAGSVLLGTLYPLALDALHGGKISVGAPYFETIFVPLIAPAIFLMGVGPMANWKHASLPSLAARVKWAAVASTVSTLLVALASGHWSILSSLGFLMGFWILSTAATHFLERIKPTSGSFHSWIDAARRLRSLPLSWLGMLLAHCGIAVFIIGVTAVKTYEVEKDIKMEPGDLVEVGGYTFTFHGSEEFVGPNYIAMRGTVEISKQGKFVRALFPEKRMYQVQKTPMTEAAIDTGMMRDLYVSLGEPTSASGWIVRIYYKPFISWIWGGCFMMALGGLLAVGDRRYRKVQAVENAIVPHAPLSSMQEG